MNTEPELSAGEACRTHSLTNEDFARLCNPDGSLKSQPQTTTFSLKNNPSKTITVNNTVLYVSGALLITLLIGAASLVIRRRNKKKKIS